MGASFSPVPTGPTASTLARFPKSGECAPPDSQSSSTLNSDFESGVIVPVAQALFTGIVAGLAAWALALLLGWERPEIWAGGSAGICTAVAWLHLLSRWYRLQEADRGLVEKPPQETHRLELTVTSEDGSQGAFLRLRIAPEKLEDLAAAIVDGEPFGFNLVATGLLTRSEFLHLRGQFLKHDLVRWRDPTARTQGMDVQPFGRSLFNKMAKGDWDGLGYLHLERRN